MNRATLFTILLVIIFFCVGFISCRRKGIADEALEQLNFSSVQKNVPVFEPAVFNYGKVLQREHITHEFRLLNQSTNTVWIAAIQTTCSCTTAHVNDFLSNAIPPRSELVFPVSFETGLRFGKNESTVSVILVSSNHIRYLAECKMRGEIIPDFTIEPKSIDFGILRSGQICTQAIVFRPDHLKTLKLFNVHVEDNIFRIASLQEKTNTGAIVISVAIQAPDVSKKVDLRGSLKAMTTSERFTNVDIPLYGQVLPDEEVYPNPLVFLSSDFSSESRLTVITRNLSRIDRIFVRGKNSYSRVQTQVKESAANDWADRHYIKVTNSAIKNAAQLDVELSVNKGAGIMEARTVSVKIVALNNKQNEKDNSNNN